MAFRLASAFVELFAKDDKLQQGMANARQEISGQMQMIQGMAQAAVVGGLGAFAAFSINAAAAAEEAQSKFEAVFKELTPQAEEFANKFAKDIGRGVVDTKKQMSQFQDTFVPMGFAREEAAKLSQEMTTLAVDLASFNDIADTESAEALTSALVGNHEAVRKFGVVITEATLKAELMRMGLEGNIQKASTQEKVQARLNLIYSMTSDAQGDAARTAGSFTNKMKALQGAVADTAAAIGGALLPVLTPFVSMLSSALRTTLRVNDALHGFIGMAVISTAAVIALTISIRAMQAAWAQAVMQFIVTTGGVAAIPIAIGVAVMAAIAAVKALIGWLGKQNKFMAVWQVGVAKVQEAWSILKTTAMAVIMSVLDGVRMLGKMFGIDIPVSIQAMQEWVVDAFSTIVMLIAEWVLNMAVFIQTVVENWELAWDLMKTTVLLVVSTIQDKFSNAFATMLQVFKLVMHAMITQATFMGRALWDVITDPGNAIGKIKQRMADAVAQTMQDMQAVSDAFNKDSPATKILKDQQKSQFAELATMFARNKQTADRRVEQRLDNQNEEIPVKAVFDEEQVKQEFDIKGFNALDQLSRKIQDAFLKDEKKANEEKLVSLGEKQTSIQEMLLEEAKKTSEALTTTAQPAVAGV